MSNLGGVSGVCRHWAAGQGTGVSFGDRGHATRCGILLLCSLSLQKKIHAEYCQRFSMVDQVLISVMDFCFPKLKLTSSEECLLNIHLLLRISS